MGQAPPLGVYVHWPYCARICPYCDFNVFRARGREAEAANLARAVVADLEAHAALTGPRELVSVFFGGGTPSLMDPAWVGEIVETARRLWTPATDMEVSLEANPTDAEAARYAAFADAGVNRLSLGLQSIDDEALRFLGRDHDAAEGLRAAKAALAVFPRVSLDLIYARPGQSPQIWANELRSVAGLGAEHLSPYQLTIETGTAFDRAARRGTLTLPDDEAGAVLYEITQAVLQTAGFEAYEVSNHARGVAAQSRHNLVYWRGWDYAGAGPGAHGRLTTAAGGRLATEAVARPADYIRRVAETGVGFATPEVLSPIEMAEERLLSGLRTLEGVAFAEVAALELGPDHPRVGGLVDLGLLSCEPDRLLPTAAGRRLLDRVIAELAGA